jgi:hypothetical protein
LPAAIKPYTVDCDTSSLSAACRTVTVILPFLPLALDSNLALLKFRKGHRFVYSKDHRRGFSLFLNRQSETEATMRNGKILVMGFGTTARIRQSVPTSKESKACGTRPAAENLVDTRRIAIPTFTSLDRPPSGRGRR